MKKHKKYDGLIIALSIITVWGISLTFLLSLNVSKLPIWLIVPAVFWQMFLYTGLFVTTHDTIHGVVYPQNQKINDLIGLFAIFLYGFISYKKLAKKHWEHHRYPASEFDPDFYMSPSQNPFRWYLNFMKNYWSWGQVIGFTLSYNGTQYFCAISQENLLLFWLIPLVLSSLQLFYFGTFLPHQEPEGGYTNPHRARTIVRSFFLSFITCYHFGYHWEHHEYPDVPWWGLPAIAKCRDDTMSRDVGLV